MNQPNIIFMGTPEFSVPALVQLHEKYGLKAVVTVPDKPKGRGKKLTFSPVKEKAIELGIKVFQPESLKDNTFLKDISQLDPDIFCVIAFRILPQALYEMPRIASFNIHGSLLPKYRGAAPINWAIINGENSTGLTSFVLQKQVDTGDILLKREVNIQKYETFGDLYSRLMPISAELSIETCELLISGEYTPIKQDDSQASPAPKIFRENLSINWNLEAKKIADFIHGVSPVPCAWTNWNDEKFKIFRVEVTNRSSLASGKFEIDKTGFYVGTSDYNLSLIEFQLPAKKSVKFNEFYRGYRGEASGQFYI